MELLLLFFIYAFLGWTIESIYCSVPVKHWINRGFLNGPFCPIYACGALAIVGLLQPLEKYPITNNLAALFLCSVGITSILEYITGFLLETIFKTKWWDYSKNKYNIKGRVCLKNSLLFGLLSVFLLKVLHPFLQGLIEPLPFFLITTLDFLLLAYFVWDISVTLRAILQMNNNLERLQQAYMKLKEEVEEKVGELENLPDKLDRDYLKEKAQQAQLVLRQKFAEKAKTFSMDTGRSQRHLIKAFPNMKSHRYKNALEELKKTLVLLKRY